MKNNNSKLSKIIKVQIRYNMKKGTCTIKRPYVSHCCCCCYCCASGDIEPRPSPPKDLPQCIMRNNPYDLLCYQFSLRTACGLESTSTKLDASVLQPLQGPPGLIRSSGTFATLLKSVNDVLWVKLDYPNWHHNSSQVISCLVITYACMARDVRNPK